LTGIFHYLRFENDPMRSHTNAGLRWLGTHEFDDDQRLVYRVEAMHQGRHADGASIIDADYLALELGYKAKNWGIGGNLELLSGDGVYGFQRPLATLHAYNGWADRFLNTPAEGLVDTYLTGNVKLGGYALAGQFHRFESDMGDIHFGDELGLALSHKCGNRFDVMLKYAHHDAKDVGADVQKVWLSFRIAENYKLRR